MILQQFTGRIIRIFSLACLLICLSACSETPALTPLSSDAVVLAFGDSLTFGTGADKQYSYPAVLQSLIRRQVINAGIPGEISSRGTQRLPALLERHQPALLILCHGGNDILRRMSQSALKQNLQQMIAAAQSQGIQVVLLAVPAFGVLLKPADVYKEIANEMKVPLLESILPDILSDSSLKADQIHPNAEGYRILAEHIYTNLELYGALDLD